MQDCFRRHPEIYAEELKVRFALAEERAICERGRRGADGLSFAACRTRSGKRQSAMVPRPRRAAILAPPRRARRSTATRRLATRCVAPLQCHHSKRRKNDVVIAVTGQK
jgi:hypothetical protein